MATITATGIGSGLDVNTLVTQLVTAERSTSDTEIARETSDTQAKLSALGTLKSVFSSFQSSFSDLNAITSFDNKTASSSNSSQVSAVVRPEAIPNTYNVEVSQLATSHSLASMSFADTTSAVGTGTLTFRFGTTNYNTTSNTYNGFTLNPDSKVTTLTIDSTNNSLTGIMTAINKANFGVTASIVQAGDGYKLLLTSNSTGAKNSLEVTANDSDGNNTDTGANAGLSNFAFSASAANMAQTSAAQDSNFKINGLALTNASNTISNAISGLDLTLSGVTTSPQTVSVTKDNSKALSAMQSFIAGYNTLTKTLNSLAGYDATNKQAGPLLGDFTVRSVMDQASSILYNAVSGLTGDTNSLVSIGVTTGSDGTLTLDTTKFTNLLNNSPEQLLPLFSAQASATDPNISYSDSSDSTAVGSYAVTVSQLATSGSLTGAGTLPSFTPGNYVTLDSSNNGFTVEVDGVSSGALTLTTGQYQSGSALAQEIQARINGATPLVNAGVSVNVSYDSTNNAFKITSNSVGSTSTINMTAVGANTAATLGFGVQNGNAGLNVAGTIGGVAASGFGNVLTADSSIAAQGLKLTIGGTTTGSRGTVNFTRGVTNQMNLLFNNVLATTGGLQARIDTYNQDMTDINNKKASLETRWADVTARYQKQFTDLDTLISQLNSTGSFLTQQLASLPGVVQK
ncbi:MAG TPA: flagellar filament capping protein FliD [Candidatus Acidoferrum sp.]|nr:flagellar filament capping protein FliD [Candidatus Acidoferrum sp.]